MCICILKIFSKETFLCGDILSVENSSNERFCNGGEQIILSIVVLLCGATRVPAPSLVSVPQDLRKFENFKFLKNIWKFYLTVNFMWVNHMMQLLDTEKKKGNFPSINRNECPLLGKSCRWRISRWPLIWNSMFCPRSIILGRTRAKWSARSLEIMQQPGSGIVQPEKGTLMGSKTHISSFCKVAIKKEMDALAHV